MRPILRWEGTGKPRRVADECAAEEPLEIRIENQPVAVTMRTPGHDRELAAGYLFSEGIIRSREQVVKITTHPRNPNVIGVFLAEGARVDFGRLERHTYVSSSCGLCGKSSIAAVRRKFPPIRSKLRVGARTLSRLPEGLRAAQATFARTGGLHAAGVFHLDGALLLAREDIGRHNAVDKILGHGVLEARRFDENILVVSGRASFEIMQKALAGRFPIVVAVSAPSDLAVEFARANGQTLAGFVRGDRFNLYAGAGRVRDW